VPLNSSEFMRWKNSLSFHAISMVCSLFQMCIGEGHTLNRKQKQDSDSTKFMLCHVKERHNITQYC